MRVVETARRGILRLPCWLLIPAVLASGIPARAQTTLPGTEPLEPSGDLARRTNEGWRNRLWREIAAKKEMRAGFWKRDPSSAAAYELSVQPNRERLRRHVGAIDDRVKAPQMELISSLERPGPLAESVLCEAWRVRWTVWEGVHGEGILLRPKRAPEALVVFLPDADQLPEEIAGLAGGAHGAAATAQQLAESGAVVVIPTLVNRGSRHAGDERLGIWTNQSQREWIYRQAAPTGRHIIGYEVQRILAAVDWWLASNPTRLPVGVAGHGEGGLLALYSAALDTRIDAAWVGGYFQPREEIWKEPLYRNVWGLLEQFGDAEIASLVAPRALIVEADRYPEVPSPPAGATGPAHLRSAAPGTLTRPSQTAVAAEWQRALALAGQAMTRRFRLTASGSGESERFGGTDAVRAFGAELTLTPANPETVGRWRRLAPSPAEEAARREHRTMLELQEHAQTRLRQSEYRRDEEFWSKLSIGSPADWANQIEPFRDRFVQGGIGRMLNADAPLRPRTRLVPERSMERWSTYEVVLDVYPDAIAWGYLILPADLRAGERRPVVVCQHGSGGLPSDTMEENPEQRAHQIYQGFAARLAARGFVVFAPYLINRMGGDDYRQLQRMANPLRQSLSSILTISHERILRWLRQQPFVDPARIAFYGMSYGSKAAIRTTAAMDGFAVTICSGDFGDNIANMTTVRHDRNECMFYPDFELIEFGSANAFNYAELAALIAPRPFMVEFGYRDRAVQLEGAAAEYAKVARLYHRLGIPERTAIEYFDGPHTVPGRGTFEFLHRFLEWPRR